MSAIRGLSVERDDGTLAAWRLGAAPAGAPVVVALHGITATSRAWLAVAAALGEDAALLAPDLRGRGASAPLHGPYGLDAHASDLLALLDAAQLRAPVVVVGHSLGAFIACRFATRHSERVRSLVLVDGGLPLPGSDAVLSGDRTAVIQAVLGPAIERLGTEFPDRGAHRAWWAAHPAFAGSDVDPELLGQYADYDLCGEPPRLRSSVDPAVVPVDGGELLGARDAGSLAHPAVLLHAPRGMTDGPDPLQPGETVGAWVAGAPDRRRAVRVSHTNHFTIAMGSAGATAIAREVRRAL